MIAKLEKPLKIIFHSVTVCIHIYNTLVHHYMVYNMMIQHTRCWYNVLYVWVDVLCKLETLLFVIQLKVAYISNKQPFVG